MAFSYTLFVQETKPTGVAPGNTFWLRASQGLMSVAANDGLFSHIAAGKSNLSISNGTYFKTVTESATAPVSPTNGDVWINTSNHTAWAYLGKWTPFGGN